MGNTNSFSTQYLGIAIGGIALSSVAFVAFFIVAWLSNKYHNPIRTKTRRYEEQGLVREDPLDLENDNYNFVGINPLVDTRRSLATGVFMGLSIVALVMYIILISDSSETFNARVDVNYMDIVAAGGCNETLANMGICTSIIETAFLVLIWVSFSLLFTFFMRYKVYAMLVYGGAQGLSFLFFLAMTLHRDQKAGGAFWGIGAAVWLFTVAIQAWSAVEGFQGSYAVTGLVSGENKTASNPYGEVERHRRRLGTYGQTGIPERLPDPSTKHSGGKFFTMGKYINSINYHPFTTLEGGISIVVFILGLSFLGYFGFGTDGLRLINRDQQFGWLLGNIGLIFIIGGFIIWGTAMKQQEEIESVGSKIGSSIKKPKPTFNPSAQPFISVDYNNSGKNFVFQTQKPNWK